MYEREKRARKWNSSWLIKNDQKKRDWLMYDEKDVMFCDTLVNLIEFKPAIFFLGYGYVIFDRSFRCIYVPQVSYRWLTAYIFIL